ncbi:MAG: undecaprenyldiphospho-muramoylpentapeptide beta-N-acetylglucosaminyltransferase, partial [Promicromonosporaceae bacterium]|nr:undecaprenyldiphospho-muramoylpentapeptide beta-N-acetylglucosaminyltransferase [Promicromonosporaceae bacterium]
MSALRAVVLAGGGTAGHVNPLLAIADELTARHPAVRLLALGTATGLEAELVPARGYDLREIPRVPLPRRPSLDWFRLPGRLRAAVDAAAAAITEIDAQVVVGMGGYVSTPAYLAARRLGVPVVIHEQNARPGLANRLGARWATAIGLTFPDTRLRPKRGTAEVVGLPLRHEIASLASLPPAERQAAQVAARRRLGLDPTLPTLLITGGSSGAVNVNRAVAGAAAALLETGAQVLHLTGRGKSAGITPTERYHVLEYCTEMEQALAAADLVIARAGAGTVCELAALGLPGIYVPLAVGNGEQRLNAAAVVQAGGGVLVPDAKFTPQWVAETVPGLLGDSGRLTAMAVAARSCGVVDAAVRIAAQIEAAALRPGNAP